MTNEKLNTALYEKMFAEQETYRAWLLSQPPEGILNHTYEYTFMAFTRATSLSTPTPPMPTVSLLPHITSVMMTGASARSAPPRVICWTKLPTM